MINDEQLFFGDPLYIDGVGILTQPTVRDILRVGSENYDYLLSPFIITSDYLASYLNGEYADMDIYDFLFLEENLFLAQCVTTYLNMIFRQDIDYELRGDTIQFKVGQDGIVCRDNFEKLQEIVRGINCIKLAEPEKLPSNMTPEQLRIHEKMKSHRSRRAKIDTPTLKEVINTVMHRGESFIPYNTVGNFTYYQLKNSYNTIVGLNEFDEYMGYKLSPKYELKEDMPSWQKIIKAI